MKNIENFLSPVSKQLFSQTEDCYGIFYVILAVHQSLPIFSTLLLLTQHFSPTTLLRQFNLVVQQKS